MSEINQLIKKLAQFRDDRDWEQFHNSKDLALAISIEASELNELFLWKGSEEVDEQKLQDELADIFCFALLLADKHNFDVGEIVDSKIKKNSEKYPIGKSRGNATKYTDL